MKKLRGWILIMTLLFGLLGVTAEGAWSWQGYVSKVIDGDSFLVKRGRATYEVRLYGIDAPEYGQRFGHAAKSFAKRIVHKRVVTIEPRDVDRYGRVVAVVKSRGRLVNREIVGSGFAWVSTRYCRDKKLCAKLKGDQGNAREAGRGLWKDKAPVPPWQWKKR